MPYGDPVDIPEFEMRHRLALALEHATVSITEMAETLDCATSTVGNYLHGRTRPRKLVLQAWALRCGVPYEWLLTGNNPLPKAERGVDSSNHSYQRRSRAWNRAVYLREAVA